MQPRHLLSIASMLAIIVLLLLPAAVSAQTIEPGPRPTPPILPPIQSVSGVSVQQHYVEADVEGPVANVTVQQVFHNGSRSVAEGVFLFPLPSNAAVSDFQMSVDGQVLEGQVMDADQARAIYEATVRKMRDPALLEYAGRGVFRTSVFPIPPGESRTLQFRYSALLDSDNGLYRFSYPGRLPGATRMVEKTELVVNLHDETGLRAIYSPAHSVTVDRVDNEHAIVRYDFAEETTQSDFELFFGTGDANVGLNLLSSKPYNEDGYYILLAAPAITSNEAAIAARDLIFVLDISGSMTGEKLKQAKGAVRYVVEHLNAGDRFNLLAFSTGVSFWEERLTSVSSDSVASALDWIDRLEASGSTDINRALMEALGQLSASDNKTDTGYVLFMTDGLPTQGETEPSLIIRNAMNNKPEDVSIRLFTFGVGYDVNTDLLDRMSDQMGGRSRYVQPDQQIDEAVSAFYATIQTPVLTNVEVDFGDGPILSDTYPYPLPDLFAGEQLVVAGRYRNGGDVEITLSGTVDGELVTVEYPSMRLATTGGDPFVGRLWATRKIGSIMQQIRIQGPEPELVDAIVDLSLRFGIVTPYTSYLVEEPNRDGLASTSEAYTASGGVILRSYGAAAKESVQAQAMEAYAAPASGADAVTASDAREQLRSATSVQENRDVRTIGSRTLVAQGTSGSADDESQLWIDTAYTEDMELETILFLSDRYFELADDPDLAPVLALSSELLIVLDEGHALRITADESIEGVEEQQGDDALGQYTPDEQTSLQHLWDTVVGAVTR